MLCHSKKRRKQGLSSLLWVENSSLVSCFLIIILFLWYHISLRFFPQGCGTLWLITMATWWLWTGRHHTPGAYTCPPSTSLSTRYHTHTHTHTHTHYLSHVVFQAQSNKHRLHFYTFAQGVYVLFLYTSYILLLCTFRNTLKEPYVSTLLCWPKST